MPTIVLTGASDGIGAAAAGILAAPGTRLVLVGRSPEKTRAVAERVGAEHHVADFTRLDEVRALAERLESSLERIDVLAHNAGGLFSGPTLTEDGVEKTFQVNHLAPVLLTRLLRDRLLASRAAIVHTSSAAARLFGRVDLDDLDGRRHYRPLRAYGTAKLANVLFTRFLHERFHDDGISAVAFHPGIVSTSFASDTTSALRRLYHGAFRRLLRTPEEGGAALARLVSGTPGETWRSGGFFDEHGRPSRTHRQADDPEIVRRHAELSAELLGIRW